VDGVRLDLSRHLVAALENFAARCPELDDGTIREAVADVLQSIDAAGGDL
jgi:hypothetical protein